MNIQNSWEESFLKNLIDQIHSSEKIKWRDPYLRAIPPESTGKSLKENAERIQLLQKLESTGGPHYPPSKRSDVDDYNWPQFNGEAHYLTQKDGRYTVFFYDRGGMSAVESFTELGAAAEFLLGEILGDLRLQARLFGHESKK